jgi:hypothetical protein
MLKNIHYWLPAYLKQVFSRAQVRGTTGQTNLLFTVCDHYEPFWNKADEKTAYSRVKKWIDCYPLIAERHTDKLGNHPKHCFFYPEEEYRQGLLDLVAELCRNGYGETEIHLHHDNDTDENLRRTLIDFKNKLSQQHGLLSRDVVTSDIMYGFIHGNWALDNSRPDGKWCGVNNELTILQETGCYADFTMPSAPSNTQTKKINSIYYAIDDPFKPKSHDMGISATTGSDEQKGLLCIQGPLSLNLRSRKYGFFPRIENGRLAANMGMGKDRISMWVKSNICVQGECNTLFVKLYSHGTQEKDMKFFFDEGGLNTLYTNLEEFCDEQLIDLYYVSARNMYNVVKGLEEVATDSPRDLYDFRLQLL